MVRRFVAMTEVFDVVQPAEDAIMIEDVVDIKKTKDIKVKKEKKPGVVYLSRIPPTMTPHELRSYMEPFGKLGRLYLAPDERTQKTGKHKATDPRERMKARYTEGWLEFLRRKDAKTAALAFNGSTIGGKKSSRFHDEIWNLKYLPDFLWTNLTEQSVYDKAVRQQKLRTEISQSRKVNAQYVKQAEKAREMGKIEETRTAKRVAKGEVVNVKSKEMLANEQLEALGSKFRQRKPVKKE